MMKITCFSGLRPALVIGASMLLLAGCSGVKDNVRGTLGLNKGAPDEFAVRTRAPLEMPTTMTLPPPVPGMQRPQEKTTIVAAKEAVFGEKDNRSAKTSIATGSSVNIETILLEKTGANSVETNIRTIVNTETQEIAEKNQPVAKKILNMAGRDKNPPATIVDAKAEYERIKKNAEEGKSILDGETPMIDVQ